MILAGVVVAIIVAIFITPFSALPQKVWSSSTGLFGSDPQAIGLIRTFDRIAALDPAGGNASPHTEVFTFNSGMDSAGKKWKFYRVGDSDAHTYVIENGKKENLLLTGNESGKVTLDNRREDDSYQLWRVEDGQLRNDKHESCILHERQQKGKIELRKVGLGRCGTAAGTSMHGSDQWMFPSGL